MRVLLIALLAAISYAQTGSTNDIDRKIATYKKMQAMSKALGEVIKEIVFEKGPDGEITILDGMKERVRGQCLKKSDYVASLRSGDWQCGDNFFHSGGLPYKPEREVLETLAGLTGEDAGITADDWASIPFFNGKNEKHIGEWCGMPAPSASGFELSENYWTDCVMPRAGYFNVLQCDGEKDDTYAVIGIAALNVDVCYPAHGHLNEEAYWQVNKGGIWRTWHPENASIAHEADIQQSPNGYDVLKKREDSFLALSKKDLKRYEIVVPTGKQTKDGIDITQHNHMKGIAHEMDTTEGKEPMVLIYYWAKDNNDVPDIQYHHASYVNDQGSCAYSRMEFKIDPETGASIPDDDGSFSCDPLAGTKTSLSITNSINIQRIFDFASENANLGLAIFGALFLIHLGLRETCKSTSPEYETVPEPDI